MDFISLSNLHSLTFTSPRTSRHGPVSTCCGYHCPQHGTPRRSHLAARFFDACTPRAGPALTTTTTTTATCGARAWQQPWWSRSSSTRIESTFSSGGASPRCTHFPAATGRRLRPRALARRLHPFLGCHRYFMCLFLLTIRGQVFARREYVAPTLHDSARTAPRP